MTKSKSLRLRTETVRVLTAPALRQVAAGSSAVCLGGPPQASFGGSPSGGGGYQLNYNFNYNFYFTY